MAVIQSSPTATASEIAENCSSTTRKPGDVSLILRPFWIYAFTPGGGSFSHNRSIHVHKAPSSIFGRETNSSAPATKRKHDDEAAISHSARLSTSLPPSSSLVRRWTESVPEESAERPPKRIKLEDNRSRFSATLSGSGANASLRCPLAVADPERHSACGQMPSNGAVARHLFQHHRRAPYCPTCWTTFTSDTERDGHIRLRECKQAESRHIDGLSVKQLAQLVRCFDLEDDCESTWLRLLRLVAPN